MDKALKALEILVVNSIDGDDEEGNERYDVYLGGELVLTNVKTVQASSYIMKHQRKINSILGANQRQLDYVNRWQLYSQKLSEGEEKQT